MCSAHSNEHIHHQFVAFIFFFVSCSYAQASCYHRSSLVALHQCFAVMVKGPELKGKLSKGSKGSGKSGASKGSNKLGTQAKSLAAAKRARELGAQEERAQRLGREDFTALSSGIKDTLKDMFLSWLRGCWGGAAGVGGGPGDYYHLDVITLGHTDLLPTSLSVNRSFIELPITSHDRSCVQLVLTCINHRSTCASTQGNNTH